MRPKSKRNSMTGVYAINQAGQKEVNVTIEAWSTITGLTDERLKHWVTEVVLPTLPVFLDWSSAIKSKHKGSTGYPKEDVIKAMSADLGHIKQLAEVFINNAQVSPTAVWAHTCLLVRGHLEKVEACGAHFKTSLQYKEGAFDFIKFLMKNLNEARWLKMENIATAEAARIAFVQSK